MEAWNKLDTQKKIAVAVIAIIVIIGGFLLFRNFNNSSTNDSSSTISGAFNINGAIPEDATITVYASEYDPAKADVRATNVVAEEIEAEDGASLSFSDLPAGTTYSVNADIISEGETVSSSNHLVITAPATGVELIFNIETVNAEANAEISGAVVVHGFIPEGSTVTIEGRIHGTGNYSVVTEGITAERSQTRTFNEAITGESYDIIGVLYNAQGQRIGTSSPLVVTAPARNETLVINSSATPPEVTTETISGTITFNGVAPADSRIVILQRENNTSDFQVAVDNVQPVNGSTWSWDKAENGTWYDIQAVLKQKQSNNTDKDIAKSNVVSRAAPATNVRLTINSGLSNPAPREQISLACINQSGDQWNAQLTIPNVPGAQTYWYQVGTSNGGNDVANTTVAANGNNDVQVNLTLANLRTFYFRYAFANVAGVGVGNSQFSPFSATSQGSCGF